MNIGMAWQGGDLKMGGTLISYLKTMKDSVCVASHLASPHPPVPARAHFHFMRCRM